MNFLRTFSLVILFTVFIFSGCQPEKEHSFRYSEYMKENKLVTILKVLENDFLSVKIYSNSFTEIEDLNNGKHWETWSVALQDKGMVEVGEVWMRTGRSLTPSIPRALLWRKGRGQHTLYLSRKAKPCYWDFPV